MDTIKNLAILDSTMKMELLKAWTFDLKKKISVGGIEPSDATQSLRSASDALKVAEHFLSSDSVSGSVNDIVYHRLITEVMDLINGVDLCLIAIEDLDR